MAIINNRVQQAAGVDNITINDLNSNTYPAGIYKIISGAEHPLEFNISYDKNNDSVFYLGTPVNTNLYKTYDHCTVIMTGDNSFNAKYTLYNSSTQIIIPYNDSDQNIIEYFIRFNNESGAWSNLAKFKAGESLQSVISEEGYYLVDNKDPMNPIILSDRTKLDKYLNYTFTGGLQYEVGDVIPTSDPGRNAQVITVDSNTGEILKLAITEDPLTTTKGHDAVVTLNTEIAGSAVEFDKYGNLKPSAFKSGYIKPYEFTYQSSYVHELNFDEIYDASDLAGGSSDYGFAYHILNANDFNYRLIDKATDERIYGTIDLDYSRPIYTLNNNPGSLIWYGYVDTDKVRAIDKNAKGYQVGDTFTFQIKGATYNGTIDDISQSPYKITTDIPVDAGSAVTGFSDTVNLTGTGTGLQIYVAPTIPNPCYNINVKDIPDKSFVWSGVKVRQYESKTKIGSIRVPVQFSFDIKVNGEIQHVVECFTVSVTGVYGTRSAWKSSNYNTVTPNSEIAENWNVGDEFTVSILGETYQGMILDTDTEPYTITVNIPQTTDLQMTGSYIAIAKEPSTGKNLIIDVNTVNSYTYKLDQIYVDPHGGNDPAFYANSQVDILLAQQRVQAGTPNNIVAFTGQEGKFSELVRTESINSDDAHRSDYNIPTERAVANFVENLMDNDTIANLTSTWISAGEQLSLNKSSGEVASSVVVPYASSAQDGLIKKELFDQINLDHTQIEALRGLDQIGAALGNKSSITQDKLTNAWLNAGKPNPIIGNKIINTSEGDNQGHNWMYLDINGTPQWVDTGSGNVAVATNSLQGVVMGTEPDQDYDYYSSIIKQTGSAANFIGETLSTDAVGAEHFKVKVLNTDSNGLITIYDLTPKTGVDRKMLANIPFTASHDTALYYNTSYRIDTSNAKNYKNKESFTINGITGGFSGYVINATVDPILCITNIPSKTETDISGVYTTTSSDNGTGLKIVVTSTPYYEKVTFRLNITSWENPTDTIEISDSDGHMKASGVATLAEHVKFLNDNKADKEEITLTSNDNTILINKPEGFENLPNFDLSFNIAASAVWITLTGLLDGVTSEWDITPYLQGISTSNLEFYYGDGILFNGIDYVFNSNINILLAGAGYAVGDIIMLNNDTRSAKITQVGPAGEILAATLVTNLPGATNGNGADLAAQFIFKSLKNPPMDSAKNRTFMCKGTRLSLISDLSGVTEVIDPTGTLNASVTGNTATVSLNVNNVFRANSSQPCYIELTQPTESQGILTQGSLQGIIQSLTNNMKYVMDNAVWKYKNSDSRVEIAVQDENVTAKPDVNIITIKPKDLGQIAKPDESK